jgi:hypothetical protein
MCWQPPAVPAEPLSPDHVLLEGWDEVDRTIAAATALLEGSKKNKDPVPPGPGCCFRG